MFKLNLHKKNNKFTMTEKENYIEYWKEKWLNGKTFFHRNKPNT